MKTLQTTALLALMTAAIGTTAIAPAFAQTAPAQTQTESQASAPGAGPRGMGPQHGGHQFGQHGGQGGLGMIGFQRGAEGVELALVRLSYAIDMTAEQQALFDTFKADALAAAQTFETAAADLRPAAPAQDETAERPGIGERIEARIALQRAHLEALEAVAPAMTAFFDSLTDAQTADLMPQRGHERGADRGDMHKGPMGKPGQHQWGERGPRAGG